MYVKCKAYVQPETEMLNAKDMLNLKLKGEKTDFDFYEFKILDMQKDFSQTFFNKFLTEAKFSLIF